MILALENCQQYGDGNRLLSSETATSGESSVREYGYDGAGRRTSVRGAETGDYSYGWGGQSTRVSESGVTTSTGYDGLGRAVTKQVETAYSSDTVTSSYLGGTMTGTSSVLHGDASVLWGALGRLEGIAVDGDDSVRWALLDRLGSVVAEATGTEGADISELVSYAEYGKPSFESVGYQNPYGFTGQLQDGGTGRVSFGSRDYDPVTAAWFAPDEWPGLLTAPQSLNRYAYVLGNPVTFADAGGFKPYEPGYSVSKNGSGWQYQKEAPKTVLNPSALLNHYGTGKTSGWNSSNARAPYVLGPNSYSSRFESERHVTATRKCEALTMSPTCATTFVVADRFSSKILSTSVLQAWLTGKNPRTVRFGSNTVFTEVVRNHESSEQLRAAVRNSLQNGTSLNQLKGYGYAAGRFSPTNGNLWRDGVTALTWDMASDEQRTLLLLGTYDLTAEVVEPFPGANSAVVRFTATNRTTLGSLLRTGSQATYDSLNQWAGATGPLSEYVETFTWDETVKW